MIITPSILRNADETLFRQIFDEHYAALCRYANQFLADTGIAEEIVDDVLLYIWNRRRDLEFQNLQHYLMGLVRNRCFTHLNSAKQRYETTLSSVAKTQNIIAFMDTIFSDTQHPLEQLIIDEQNDYINRAIQNLPPATREVYLLSRNEQLKYAEIAQQLGISINTVKYHLKQANRMLTEQLTQYVVSVLILFTL